MTRIDDRHRRDRCRPCRARHEPRPCGTPVASTSCSSAADIGDSWRRERWDSLTLLTPGVDEPAARDGRRGRPRRLPHRRRLRRAACRRTPPPSRRPVLPRTPGARRAPGRTRHRLPLPRDDGRQHLAGAQRRPRHGTRRPPGRPAGRSRTSSPDVRRRVGCGLPQPARPCAPVVCSWSAPRPRGVQIADELARSGRRVLIAVGRHTRVPRRYRGMDIYWWLQRTGRLDRRIDDVADPRRGTPGVVAAARRARTPRTSSTSPPCASAASRCWAAGSAPTAPACGSPTTSRPPARSRRAPDEPPARRHRRAHRAPRAWSARSCPRTRPPASSRRRRGRTRGPARRGDHDRRPGHGLPHARAVAAGPGARRRGQDPPAPRRHAGPRPLHRRPAVPDPAQLRPDRRRAARRRRGHRPPHARRRAGVAAQRPLPKAGLR